MSPFRFPFSSARRSEPKPAFRHHARRRSSASVRNAGHGLAIERYEPRTMLAAQILQVSSTIPAGTAVGIGQTIPFQVLFNEPVSVLGSPVANVNVIKAGGVQAVATYTGSSGGGLIQNFSYSVAVGDTVSQFDVPLTVPFLIGGTITTVSTGVADDADRTVLPADTTIADMQPGLSVDGIAPAVPTVAPAVYVNPTVWQTGAWATLHPDYFVISGTAGTGPLAAGEVLTVTVNGATYRATSTSPHTSGSFFVDGTGAWKVYIRSVGTNAATIPFSGILAPWSTTNTDAYNVVATLTDAAGNASTDGTVAEVTIDTVAPTLTAVNSTSTGGPDTLPGSYGVGSVLNFYVVYNEPIRVVGTPLLPINVTPGPAFATFVDVVNGNEAHFQYTVQPGDSSPGVNVTGTAISLNGGFIEDLAANPAPLAPPTAAPANTVTGILIDTVAPTVTGVTATNPNGTYVVGSPTITITVTFDQAVTVTGGTPLLALNSAPGRTATYAGGSGTTTLSFSYTVLPGDDTPDLDYTSITALSLNGAAIRDAAGNAAVLTLAVPGTAGSLGANKAIVVAAQPKVIQVSSPDLAGVYTAGQTVRIRVMFDKVVAVAGGPSPTLSLGTTPASTATWSNAGSGGYIDGGGAQTTTPTNILQFNYLVKPGDTTSGAPLNYVSILSLSPGAGINLSPAPVSPPGVLAANLQLPPLADPLNILPGAGIVIAPDTTAPLAPAIGLAVDTTNFIGNYATDGITNNTTISVTGLETLPNTTWEYRYKLGGSGAFTTWLTGGPIVGGASTFGIPGSFTYGPGAIEARQTDWTGNVGALVTNVAPSWNFDVTAPTPPVSATIPETGAAGSGVTNIPTVTVTGLEPGALLQYNATYNSSTGTLGSPTWISVAPATGISSFTGPTATFILAPGTYDPTVGTGVVVRQQDIAGNVQAGAPWTQLTTSSGGTTIIIRLDVTVATPTAGLAADTTPGFAPYTGTPYTTDGFTSNGLVNVSGLEVQNLTATPPVSGIATWEYSTSSGAPGTWTVGGTTAPTGTFTLLDNAGLPGGTVYAAGTVRVRQTDLAGNVSTAWQNPIAWTIDQTAPAIQSISAPSGTYTAGQTLTITVDFGESIYLSSTTAPTAPTLTLNTGATATLVTPVAAGATSLQFRYLVSPGEETTTLQVTAFNLNGATLADRAGNLPAGPLVGAPVTVAPGTVIISAAITATAPQLSGSSTAPGPGVGAALTTLQIVFNTPVRNFTLSSLRLYWNPNSGGTPTRLMSLRGASLRMVGTSGTNYALTLPKAATSAKGAYMLVIDGTLTNIRSTINPSAAMTTPSRIYFRR